MSKFKLLILFSVVALFSNFVVAKEFNKFSHHDYDRVLKGEKNIVGVHLEGANFKGMDLSGVDFSKTDLERANFENANLSGADFTKADLEDANLKGAKIKDTIFKGAELEFATWVNGRVCGEDSVGACW